MSQEPSAARAALAAIGPGRSDWDSDPYNSLRQIAEEMNQWVRVKFKDSTENTVFVNINYVGDGHEYDDLDSCPAPAAERAKPAANDLPNLAWRIAANIDVEHDDTMQADCKVCQRVIPVIEKALIEVDAAARREAAADMRERAVKIAVKVQMKNPGSIPQSVAGEIVQRLRALLLTEEETIPKAEGTSSNGQ